MVEEVSWHAMTVEETLAALRTQTEGLSVEEAARRLEQFGPNQIREQKRVSLVNLFFDQFRNFMVIVLLAATLISGLLGEWPDAVTIIIIVLANAVLGFFQEWKAERSLASLKRLTAPTAQVYRAGALEVWPAHTLVPGDVVALSAGDRVAADARLLRAQDLSVEEAPLTGESTPVGKTAGAIPAADAALGDRVNMVYTGTTVVRGTGLAVLVATGMDTEMGRIAHLIQTSEESETPLERRLNQLGQVLVYLSLAITVVVVLAGVIHGHAVYEMFLAGVSLAVAAIPEGLPAIVTIALALGVQRMIRRNAIVRRLPAVETLGCATVICSDKTGTLTKNEMTVKEVWVDGRWLSVQGDGYDPAGRVQDGGRDVGEPRGAWGILLCVCAACNNARLVEKEGRFQVVGDPTEGALLTLAQKGGVKEGGERVAELPFDAERKRMSVVVRGKDGWQLLVKGAPDLLITRCSHVWLSGVARPLTAELREKIDQAVRQMAGRALRTLGIAFRPLRHPVTDADAAERDLIFIGVVGMIDPPRPEVKDAIRLAASAGIRTVMITGDHQLTATAIASKIGILPERGRVMTGAELDQIDDASLERLSRNVHVYARVSPLHKLRIVRCMQARGQIVAMTGDGVNDAPAIKASDIGVAMGRTGTDVAKDASALILADDNFATIVAAIEEGRAIYDNIRKFIRYLLTSNTGEILTMFFAMLLGLPLPLLPIQILWVNLVTDGLPAIALGVDSAEEDTMSRPPRDVREGIFARGLGWKIITRGFLIGFVTLSVFYAAWHHFAAGLRTAQTMAFSTLVLAQLIHVFDCRSVMRGVLDRNILGNLWLVGAAISSLLLLLSVIYIPALQPVFHTTALSIPAWGVIAVAAAIPTFAVQARRRTRRTRRRRNPPLSSAR